MKNPDKIPPPPNTEAAETSLPPQTQSPFENPSRAIRKITDIHRRRLHNLRRLGR